MNMPGMGNNDLVAQEQLNRFIMEQEKRPLAQGIDSDQKFLSSGRDLRNPNDSDNYRTYFFLKNITHLEATKTIQETTQIPEVSTIQKIPTSWNKKIQKNNPIP